ncbi:hypothetical protein [Kibdelosporangium phytohabitans]|uniref:hypothetical protein n=1 Tax=Kibdelosporangium phytohabitans TaxID=860235 RepID=UPI001A07F4A0|nr:hypothetical protein [Kibdelosporangium phytohabitans]MBE1462161.1 hypothetical protein [Kibdelosporangium phytohabitans]
MCGICPPRPATVSGVRWNNFRTDALERQIFANQETLLDIAYLLRPGNDCR